MRSSSASATSGERARRAAADVLRQVALVTDEARQLGYAAEEAIESGLEVATRAVQAARRSYNSAVDLRNEVTHRIRREPIKAIGLAFAVGLFAGCVTEKVRAARRQSEMESEAVR
jgi:hypothetical protein